MRSFREGAPYGPSPPARPELRASLLFTGLFAPRDLGCQRIELAGPDAADGRHDDAVRLHAEFHAAENEIAREETTPLGVRVVVEGIMAMPNGTVAEVRSIRFIERGERMPRFVTAYPLKKKAAV